MKRKSTSQRQPIQADAAYSLEDFERYTGLGCYAIRMMRRRGLRAEKVGRKTFIRGAEFIRFLESDAKHVGPAPRLHGES